MHVTLGNLMLRFPHLSEMIFDSLDNQTLVTCKLLSKELNTYLREQKFHQIRIIKETVTKFQELRQPWIDVFKTANTMTIMELGYAVDQFYTKGCTYFNYKGITPLHVAAGTNNVSLFDMISEKAQEKEPIDDKEFKPIVFAVHNGHIQMTKAMMKRNEDKPYDVTTILSLIDLLPLDTSRALVQIELYIKNIHHNLPELSILTQSQVVTVVSICSEADLKRKEECLHHVLNASWTMTDVEKEECLTSMLFLSGTDLIKLSRYIVSGSCLQN